MDRYEGKPFLRLLDCYVLRSIGQLDKQHNDTMTKMEPMFHQVYGSSSPWYEIVEEQMNFPASYSGEIRAMWDRYEVWARDQHMTADPDEFAVTFIRSNFPEIDS